MKCYKETEGCGVYEDLVSCTDCPYSKPQKNIVFCKSCAICGKFVPMYEEVAICYECRGRLKNILYSEDINK